LDIARGKCDPDEQMLVQHVRMEVPGRPEYSAHVAMRHPELAVWIIESSGLATDWGIQSELVRYIARQRRTQLSVVLAGYGYFVLGGQPRWLAPGDAVELDQSRQELEGYGGSPCQVLVIEWEDESYFGRARRGEPRHSRIAPHDVARLRELCARSLTTPPEAWIAELREQLRVLGMPIDRARRLASAVPTPAAKKLYAALGEVRRDMQAQPSLAELAERISTSERQVRRYFGELHRDFNLNIEGWRDFVSDARLGWAQQLLSIPDLPLARVAQLSGFGSQIALHHALSERGGTTPGQLARRLRERWR
jgi:AraC-like DNA-binding protein